MKKNIIALFLLYSVQFIFTACSPPCDCDDASTFEVTYSGIVLTTYDTSGFSNVATELNLYKNAFGIEMYVERTEVQIALNTSKKLFTGFGFQSALACSCVGPEYIYLDPILNISIEAKNVENNSVVDVTSNFGVYDYYTESTIDFETLLESADNNWVGYQLDLVSEENIPDTVIFTFKITLESGALLEKSTNEIRFKK